MRSALARSKRVGTVLDDIGILLNTLSAHRAIFPSFVGNVKCACCALL